MSDHPEEAYIVRLNVNPPKIKDNTVMFRFKGIEYTRRNGETVKNNLVH